MPYVPASITMPEERLFWISAPLSTLDILNCGFEIKYLITWLLEEWMWSDIWNVSYIELRVWNQVLDCEVIYEMFHILNCGFEIKYLITWRMDVEWYMKCVIYWTAGLKSRTWFQEWMWSDIWNVSYIELRVWNQVLDCEVIYEMFHISLHIHSSRAHWNSQMTSFQRQWLHSSVG